MILVASNKPTHPIMISKIHVTLPFTSSNFPPYRFPPTALFNLGRLRAFSVPQEASSEHLIAPPAGNMGSLGSWTDLHHCLKPKSWWFFIARTAKRTSTEDGLCENPKSDKIEDLGHPSALKYLLTNVNQILYFFVDSMNCIFLRRKKLAKFTYPLMDLPMPNVIHGFINQPLPISSISWCLLGP